MIPTRQTTSPPRIPTKWPRCRSALNALGKESAKPLALIYVARVGLAHGKPLMASEGGQSPGRGRRMTEPSITDEGIGDPDQLEHDKTPVPNQTLERTTASRCRRRARDRR